MWKNSGIPVNISTISSIKIKILLIERSSNEIVEIIGNPPICLQRVKTLKFNDSTDTVGNFNSESRSMNKQEEGEPFFTKRR